MRFWSYDFFVFCQDLNFEIRMSTVSFELEIEEPTFRRISAEQVRRIDFEILLL